MSESRTVLGADDLAAPVYVADHDHWQEWHRRIIEACFQYGFDTAGLVHMVSGTTSAYPLCAVCGCGPARDGCWYCPTVNEGVAA